MNEGGFLAILEKSKIHLRPEEEEVSSIKADLLSSSFLSNPLGSPSDVDLYLTEAQSNTDLTFSDLQEKKKALAKSVEGLLSNLNQQKVNLRDVPEEIEKTEDALNDLYEQLEGVKANDGISTTFRQSLGKQMNSLQQLYEARDYLSVLAKAEDLALKAIAAEEKEVEPGQSESLSLLKDLNALANRVQSTLASTSSIGGSGSSIKAIPFILSQRSHAFSKLAAIRKKRLSAALKESGWPPGPVELDSAAKSSQKASEDILLKSETIKQRWKESMQLQRQCEKLRILPPSSSRLSSRQNEDANDKSKEAIQAGSQAFQPLLACQCLLAPLLLRFYYHFDSTRSTNRLDKPEWYLTHMLNIVRSNAHLFDPINGPVASLCFNKSVKLSYGYRYNLYSELLHGILRPLVIKVESSIPLLLEHSSLLSHTIMQSVQFDQDLRDVLPAAEGFSPIRLSELLLSNQSIFEAWVQSERDFTTERLDQELESGSAWTVGEGEDVDSQQDSWMAMMQEGSSSIATSSDTLPNDTMIGPKMKTTRSAQAVLALLDGLTKRYQSLPLLNLQFPFLLVQLSLLQGYAQRLDRSLDAFESMSSAFSRTIPGSIVGGGSPGPGVSLDSEGDMVRGLRGLSRLLKAGLSAIFITRHLADLSSSSFFLEMGLQMHSDRDGLKALNQFKNWQGSEEERELDKASLGELVRRGWKNSTKVASGLRPLGGRSPQVQTISLPEISSESTEMTLTHTDVWQDMRARFDQIAARSLKGIEKLVVSEVLESLRSYSHRDWDEDEVESDDSEEDNSIPDYPTPTLLPSLSLLSTHLTRLVPSLPRIDSNLVYRNISYAICTALVDRVILAGGSHRFSERGAFRFDQDVKQGWVSVVQDVAKVESDRLGSMNIAMGRKPEGPWKYLLDASKLLSIPKKAVHDNDADEITLRIAVNAVFNQNDQSRWITICKRLNIDDRMDIRLVQDILRRRIDSPR